MDKIREKIVNFMEANHITNKLKDKDWYYMEDALVYLFCEITGATDKTYEAQETNYPTLLDKKLAETDYNEFEYKIYQKIKKHFQYEDLECVLNDEEGYMPKNEIDFYKNKADIIVEKYDDYLDYDWRSAMKDAINYTGEDIFMSGRKFFIESDGEIISDPITGETLLFDSFDDAKEYCEENELIYADIVRQS